MRKILLFCVLAIGMMFLLGGCKPAAVTPEAAAPEAAAPEAAAPGEAAVTPMPTKIFSDLKCVDGKIEITVYNVAEDVPMEVGKDITLIINGLVTNPGFYECAPSTVIESGASATCTITPVKALRNENTVKISEKVAGLVKQETELVVCSAAAATEAAEE